MHTLVRDSDAIIYAANADMLSSSTTSRNSHNISLIGLYTEVYEITEVAFECAQDT